MILILYAQEEKAIRLKRVWQRKIILAGAYLKVFLMFACSSILGVKEYLSGDAYPELNIELNY
jgi:hypothetical protein